MNDLFVARPMPRSLEAVTASVLAIGLLIDLDELLVSLAGAAGGYPEAFATRQARDAALGQFGPYVEFVPASWPQMAAAGFAISDVAIGPAVCDPDYGRVAPQILDAIAAKLHKHADLEMVVHRTRYRVMRQSAGLVQVLGMGAVFDARPHESRNAVVGTVRHLTDELNNRLHAALVE
jgi:hypothetical protein